MDKKKKRVLIIVGCVVGFFVFCIILGAVASNQQNEMFAANREKVLADFEKAVEEKDLAACEAIKEVYGLVDDHEMKALFKEYDQLKDEKKAEERELAAQAEIASKTANLNQPFRHNVLEVVVKKVQLTDKVGGVILNESSLKGVKYLAVDYSYKNISKSPTHERPELIVVSPDGARYAEDISAGALYAGASADYDEEILSELNPQVHSNGVAVFKVPASIETGSGWKLEVTIEDGGFSSGKTVYLNLN